MAQKKKTLYLIDGLAIAYRSFFAFIQRPLTTSDGRNVSAIYGFVTFLSRILSEHNPDYIAVAFDTSGPTFRHEEYEEYKATRERMPEDLSDQLDTLKEVIKAYRIPLIEAPGFEADDIIGTFAVKGEKEDLAVTMVSGDKDFLQLVTENIVVMRPGKQGAEPDIVDIPGVKERFGVRPDQVTDVLALTGDSSDNVPGVPGIGEKTAIPLIQDYESLEGVYEHLEEIPKKGVKKKLTEHQKLAVLSKSLVTIRRDVPVPFDLPSMLQQEPDRGALKELYENLEFRSLLSKVSARPQSKSAPEEAEPLIEKTYETLETVKHAYHHITEMGTLSRLVTTLSKKKYFAFDTETTSTDAFRADLLGISFAVRSGEAWFVRFNNPKISTDLLSASTTDAIDIDAGLKALRPLLENAATVKIGHNIKYDIHVLSMHGIEVSGGLFDTMVAHYLLRADAQHGMDAVARETLGYAPISYTDLTGKGKEQVPLLQVDPVRLKDYACEDADITIRLYDIFKAHLPEAGLETLSKNIEMPLVGVLRKIERSGVCVDAAYLKRMSKKLGKTIEELRQSIHSHAGTEFNINSTKQLGLILFDELKLPVIRKTKTGYSTDAAVLEALKHEHPIIEALLEYRQLTKLKSTYIDALPLMIHPTTGRIHTSFAQTVAATGRLSSSDPNLQNIPIRTEAGRAIRKAFIPSEKEWVILSADYSQIELRIMAHISEDEQLQEAFRNDEDIHTATAAGVFDVSLDEVTSGMRRKAKEVNFGIMYGIGPFGLARRLEISQAEAKDIIGHYFARFPKVRQYIDDTISDAMSKGYVETLHGRRRYLPDLKSRNRAIRQNAERQAINMPIQGTAADMIKLAMIRIDAALSASSLRSTMILQVHDELVFDSPKEETEELTTIVEREMKDALPLNVPLTVEVGTGANWLDAH
jgi:DNA polymerase-1